MHGRGETLRRQRSRQEIAVMNREPHFVAIAEIEIGMAGEKSLRLRERRVGKAIHVMMPVALGMGDTNQGAEREILLHAQAGLTGQVLAGDEEFFTLFA